jgi:hypothetical protein
MFDESQRREHFKSNYLTWLAVNHLLPASLIRELSSVIVEEMSGGALSLRMLFEEVLVDGSGLLQSWAIRPLELSSSVGEYLQRRIRSIVWQHDSEVGIPQDSSDSVDAIGPADLEAAVLIGKQDLFVSTQALRHEGKLKQASLIALVAAIERLANDRLSISDGNSINVLGTLATVEMPLQVVLLKHCGDLCADADDWQRALLVYDLTLARTAEMLAGPWASFMEALHVVTTQSRSAALRTVVGGQAAAPLLIEGLNRSTLAVAPMLLLNASHDAMVASLMSAEGFWLAPDRRASMLKAPLLLANHDTSSAVEYLLEERFNHAAQNFWAVLRRQTALGSASESRSTKAQYARSLFAELAKANESNRNPGTFWMAVRLFIESGQNDQAKNIRWDGAMIRALLSADIIEKVVEHAGRYHGSRMERMSVAIECFAGWTVELASNKAELAKQMLDHLMKATEERGMSHWGSQKLAGRSVELLLEIFKNRPELRSAVASKVSNVVRTTFSSDEHWKHKSDAIKLADVCLEVFSDGDLKNVVASILGLLDTIDPSKEMWPIVQPSMEFLTSRQIVRVSKIDSELGSRVVATIVRFGLNQKSEHAHILLYLQDFDLASLQEPSASQKLEEVVRYVQTQASNINASNAIYNINALIYASKIAGKQGFATALESFQRVLETAGSKHRSISLSQGYGTLSLLVDRRQQIELDTLLTADELNICLHSILELVLQIWKIGKEDPLIFSSFSIPAPTRPNPTTVHNWAYCSILFARSLGAQSEILSALSAAESQELLKEPIDLARARLLAGGDIQALDPDSIKTEMGEAFYGALGQRLLQLENLKLPLRNKVVESLLKRMLKEGPRGLDAGILLAAATSQIAVSADDPDYLDYRGRLDNERELRLALFPMLNGVAKKRLD